MYRELNRRDVLGGIALASIWDKWLGPHVPAATPSDLLVKQVQAMPIVPLPPIVESEALQGGPFQEITLDLKDSRLSSTGVTFNVSGKSLYYKREGSHPRMMINVVSGSTFTNFYPGSRLKFDFTYLTFKYSFDRAVNSVGQEVIDRKSVV